MRRPIDIGVMMTLRSYDAIGMLKRGETPGA
jgi:hypothetical protein